MVVRLKVLRAGSALPPESFLVLIFVSGSVNPSVMLQLEGIGKLKISMTSSGLEPATFRLVE
jgi:hypothetical protein